MKIDENRNLVIPVATERVTTKVDGKDVSEDVVRMYAFHTTISRAVFDANYRVLAATKSAMAAKGKHYLMSAGPRIAALTMRDEGLRDAESRGDFDDNGQPKDDATRAFFAEIKRLTTILCPGPNGWEYLPVDSAINSGKIDLEDWQEVEASIVFFSCHVAMARKADRQIISQVTASLLNSSITSLALTEFAASLPNSTAVAATTVKPSSIPS
jgi:hypothetical protein